MESYEALIKRHRQATNEGDWPAVGGATLALPQYRVPQACERIGWRGGCVEMFGT